MEVIARIPLVMAAEAGASRASATDHAVARAAESATVFAEGTVGDATIPRPVPRRRSGAATKARKPTSWTFSAGKRSPSVQVVSSGALFLFAIALWSLAAWNDQARIDRHRRAERIAVVPSLERRMDRVLP